MLSLILAIASSSLVSIMMRLGESRCSSKMTLPVSNYAVCSLLGLFFLLRGGIPGAGDGIGFAAGLGVFGGFLFLYSLLLFQQCIARNGIVLSSAFMKLGVLVPTVTAVLIFREQPRAAQLAGFALAIAAILLLNVEKGKTGSAGAKWMLLFLLLVCGSTDALTNFYDKWGTAEAKEFFLLAVFFTALVYSAFLLHREGRRIGPWDILCGIGVGIPNYFSSRFLLTALKTVPAVVVFPVYSASALLVITAAGILIFREALNRRKAAAMLLILAALVLLNR